MSLRSTALIASVLALGLLFVSAAAAGRGGAPTTPTNLRITATTPTSISLAWNASTSHAQSWWYCVQRPPAGCFRVNPPQTTFTLGQLAANQTHSFAVYAIDSRGNRSANSNVVSYTTPPDTTPPSPPPNLSVTSVYPTRISVAWTASTDNLTQVYYTLLVNGGPYVADQIGYRSATVLDLSPETTYEFRVTARDGYGNSTQSNVLSVTTPAVTDTVPPTVPTNLRLSSETAPPEIWLDWDQSTDDTDPQSQIMYDVFINGQLDHAAIGYGETVTYCVAEGPNTIVLRAVDTSGNVSAPSNEVLVNC
jgi:chitodextrinase